MENQNPKRQVTKKRFVIKSRNINVDRSTNSELFSGKPICSVCQASGKMIATLSGELAPGITIVLDRRAFVGKSISQRMASVDWNKIVFFPTVMQLIVVNEKSFEKWQEDHADVE